MMLLQFLVPIVSAQVVISEVHWAGTDLSTADEWVEITALEDTDISGWKIVTKNSKGEAKEIVEFGTGSILGKGDIRIISNFGEGTSRLAITPWIVTTKVSLLNSKLSLSLFDSDGGLVDAVDDGIGAPFAGGKGEVYASMERVDLLHSGRDSENWVTSVVQKNVDTNSPVRGSPGVQYELPLSHSSSSTISVSSRSRRSISSTISNTVSSSSRMWIRDDGGRNASTSPNPNPASKSEHLPTPTMTVQSTNAKIQPDGSYEREGTLSINLKTETLDGSIKGADCSYDFGDGSYSASCNPPSHRYDFIGDYRIRLYVKINSETIIRDLWVRVVPRKSSSSLARSPSQGEGVRGRGISSKKIKVTSSTSSSSQIWIRDYESSSSSKSVVTATTPPNPNPPPESDFVLPTRYTYIYPTHSSSSLGEIYQHILDQVIDPTDILEKNSNKHHTNILRIETIIMTLALTACVYVISIIT